MLTIFFKASGVVAWLGPSDEKTARAFSVLATARGSTPGVREALALVTERQWFRRTWVQQEVFAARHLTLRCGSDLLTFETFLNPAREGLPLPPPLLLPVEKRAIKSRKLVSLPESLPTHFIGALRAGAHFGATNSRDKVNALLGMVNGLDHAIDLQRPPSIGTTWGMSPSQPFPVDYTRSVSQVYQDVMRYLIKETGTLDYLNYFGPREIRGDMPSWTLDWSDAHDCERLYLHFGGFWYKPHQAMRHLLSHHSARDDELCLRGHIIGLVGDRTHGLVERKFLPMDFLPEPLDDTSKVTSGLEEGEAKEEFQELLFTEGYVCRDIKKCGTQTSLADVAGRIVVPSTANEDDTIALLSGRPLVFILRPSRASTRSALVGAAWFWNGTYLSLISSMLAMYYTFKFNSWAAYISKFIRGYGGDGLGTPRRFSRMLDNLETNARLRGHEDGQSETFCLV